MPYLCRPYRGVEQLVARRAHNPKAVGSSPAPATRKSQSVDWLFSFQACLKLALKKAGNGKRRGEAEGFSLGC
jgi:hypothetical protein